MRRKLLAAAVSGALLLSTLFGCGKGNTEQKKDVEKNTAGTVKLTIWGAEKDQEILSEMVESFKNKYKGEADFEITLGVCEEADARDTVLSDIEGAADVFAFADDQLNNLVAGGALEKIDSESTKKEKHHINSISFFYLISNNSRYKNRIF